MNSINWTESNESFNTDVDRTQRLHEYLDENQIEELYHIFKSADEQKFEPPELREILQNEFNITYTDQEYERLFLKLNTDRDNQCDWDEFVSHLILGFQEDDPYNQKATLTLPIASPPLLKKAIHRHPILRILYCPTVLSDRSTNASQGAYVTISKDGTIIYWSLDFAFQRSGKSKSPTLKVAQTWILDAAVLPDVRIICTSSSERDLRFYDTTGNNFNLRIIISSLPHAVSTMFYYFPPSIDDDCKLFMGDFAGNVKILLFNAELRGPFQSKTGSSFLSITYFELLKGKLQGMKVIEYSNLHVDIVRQIQYSPKMNSFISAAECPASSNLNVSAAGLVISSLGISKTKTIIKVNKGMSCFCFDEVTRVLATGGPDSILRLWNPIMPQKATTILPGHRAGITFIYMQDNAKMVYSMDKQKILKVWDVREQNLLQTYNLFAPALSDRCAVTAYYNDNLRDIVVAGMKIAMVKCCPLLRLDLTDGDTHSRPVSVVLYNKLFKSIVTCGLDSFIIVWDPWNGKRLSLIKMAHSRVVNGEILRVQITAACFDPKHQLLLTGAQDGTLKVWNFNHGVCIRNMSIEHMCEVTKVFWVPNKMLAVGWNRHVTEFADSGESEYGDGKLWDVCHVEDVLAADAKIPETLATASYGGELVLWKLETGQPYKRYSVNDPSAQIKIIYEGQKFQLPDQIASKPVEYYSGEHFKLVGKRKPIRLKSRAVMRQNLKKSQPVKKVRKLSVIEIPQEDVPLRALAIQCCFFLSTRPQEKEYGSLFVALENGIIQVYSHHRFGSFLKDFSAIHMAGDCVTAMISDANNKYLITGTLLGYIKIWLVVNFCVPESAVVKVNKAILNLTFPFLLKDRFDGRAKRSARNTEPKLLNSFKSHLSSVNSLVYIDETEMIISGSSDKSVRLWTLAGQYIGTLGSPKEYSKLSSSTPQAKEYNYRIPPDIKPNASFTTLKVFSGGECDTVLINEEDELNDVVIDEAKQKLIYGKPLTEPILGKQFKLPSRLKPYPKPILDISLPYIPVYTHLNIHDTEYISRPVTPDILAQMKSISFMNTRPVTPEIDDKTKTLKFNVK